MIAQDQNMIDQRSVFGGAIFRFETDYLHYFGEEWEFKTKYHQIADRSRYNRVKPASKVTTIALCYFLGLTLLVLLHDQNLYFGPAGLHALLIRIGPLFLIACAFCGTLLYFTKSEYTVIPTPSHNILVRRGKDHDTIIDRLETHRLQSLRLLAAPNPANSPDEEEAKLQWLFDEGAITEVEYRCASGKTGT